MTINSEQIQALKEKAECICGILENIAGYEPGDIDGDDVELRFETEDGFDTGCNVSIVEQCQKSADVIRSLLAERDADKALIAEQAKRIDELEKKHCGGALMEREEHHVGVVNKLLERIAELEARTVKTPYLPDDCDRTEAHFKYQSAIAAAGITLVVEE
ncbi:hypothetical protein TUM17576_46970 [Enterobacter hormaechei]|nr:ead/Ea22-like family protein [Enterobacter hormaechei]GJL37877.1 hypothetical protein TUM17576_46970 [Enterobacter hormaechei]